MNKFELINEPLSWEQVGGDGHIQVYANVLGYWARDVITLRIRRNGWSGEENAKWTHSISHSSGGRDTDVEPSDAVAARNFAAALEHVANVAEERMAAHAAQWEANYQQRLADYRAAEVARRAEQEACVEADAPLGDAKAAGMMAEAVRKMLAESSHRTQHIDQEVAKKA